MYLTGSSTLIVSYHNSGERLKIIVYIYDNIVVILRGKSGVTHNVYYSCLPYNGEQKTFNLESFNFQDSCCGNSDSGVTLLLTHKESLSFITTVLKNVKFSCRTFDIATYVATCMIEAPED